MQPLYKFVPGRDNWQVWLTVIAALAVRLGKGGRRLALVLASALLVLGGINNVQMFGKAAESASAEAKRRVEREHSEKGRATPAAPESER